MNELTVEKLNELEDLHHSATQGHEWKWENLKVEEDDDSPMGIYIYVPQASYLGSTNICLADTHESSGRECLLAQLAVNSLPALISAARERKMYREALSTIRGLCMISGPETTISFQDVYEVVIRALGTPKELHPPASVMETSKD